MKEITIGIGDVHGLLGPLKELIIEVIQKYPEDEYEKRFVFVGDYIDRGPDSKGVIDFIMDLAEQYEVITLKGNHEDMFLDVIENNSGFDVYLENGGIQTLQSYGLNDFGQYRNIRIIKHIPAEHLKFLRNLRRLYNDGMRTFVHAGIDRYRPLNEQYESTLLWIREHFLYDNSMDGGYVVHGHTPYIRTSPGLDCYPNRCNLDTGGVFGGYLSAAVFDYSRVSPIDHLYIKTKRSF